MEIISSKSAEQHSGRRLHIAEGDAAFMRLLTVVFKEIEGLGYKIVKPEELLNAVEREWPDLVVIVENMELYSRFRDNPLFRGVPVLLVMISDADLKKYPELKGSDRYWTLKNNSEELLAILEEMAPVRVGKRILSVDDSPTVLKQVKKAFAGTPYILFQAENGREALDLVDTVKPDLILTDIEMPVMDGIEFCKKIRSRTESSETPLIILSSRVDYDTIAKGFDSGADEYLTKPFYPDDLLNIVESYLVPPPAKRKESVLIVSPSRNITHLLRLSLEKQGFDVLATVGPNDALDAMVKAKPDLVVCENDLDGMTGFQFCTQVRYIPEIKKTPFVLVTDKTSVGARKMGEKVGVNAYLTKPFTRENVIVLVERLLAEHRSLKALEWDMVLASIMSLARALDERDPYTKFHSENVSRYGVAIGRKAGLNKAQLENLRLAGLLHDIGKIGIPDIVLHKPDALTDDEFAMIKEHSRLGAEILQPISGLSEIIPVILHHHERIDGKGYPGGLRGDEIPELAQILAVADTWDALVTDRPYRKGMPGEKALSIMNDIKGSQLSLRYVELFIEWLGKTE